MTGSSEGVDSSLGVTGSSEGVDSSLGVTGSSLGVSLETTLFLSLSVCLDEDNLPTGAVLTDVSFLGVLGLLVVDTFTLPFEVVLELDFLDDIADLDDDAWDVLVAETTTLVSGLVLSFEPNKSPHTLFFNPLKVTFIAVFASLHLISLQSAFFTHDKICLLQFVPLVSWEPQHKSWILQHSSNESFAFTSQRQFGPSAPLNFSEPQ